MQKERRLLHRHALCVLYRCEYGGEIKCLLQTTCRVPEYRLDTLKCCIIINRAGRIRQIEGFCKLKANSNTDSDFSNYIRRITLNVELLPLMYIVLRALGQTTRIHWQNAAGANGYGIVTETAMYINNIYVIYKQVSLS